MITDSDITVYRQQVDPATRELVWSRAQIKKVHWEESQGINIAASGLSNADRYKIFIPYSNVPEGHKIVPGDVIVKGLVEDEITSSSQLEKKYTQVAKVKTVDVRTDAVIQQLWHVELGCE